MTNSFSLGGLPPPFEMVRDYKAPDPSSVETLDGFLDWADRVACQDQDRHGEARSMWIFMAGNRCMGILHTPFISPDFKHVCFELIRTILRVVPTIDRYAFINEMFYVDTRSAGEWDGKTAPSQHPKRLDGLMVIAQPRVGEQISRTYRITYDKKRRPTRHIETMFEGTSGAGAAWNLFVPEVDVGDKVDEVLGRKATKH